METIVSTVQQLASTADEAGRKEIITALNKLTLSLEKPQDLMRRISYLHVYLAVSRVGCDLKLFNHIVEKGEEPVTAKELAQQSGASSDIVTRLLRYLASVGAVKEVGPDTYTANNATHTLSNSDWQSMLYFNSMFSVPIFQALPDFLKETSYAPITDATNTPLSKAFNTNKHGMIWIQEQKEMLSHFNRYMAVHRQGLSTWLDVYPVAERTKLATPEEVLFVDVGGGLGHQAIALEKALPKDTSGKIIVQEQSFVVDQAKASEAAKTSSVEFITHDFLAPQPIKHARMYYLRNIIHDWPDAPSITILRHLRDAMDQGSVLLIDEMVLPDTGAHWQTTQQDLLMMSAFGARERSRGEWERLCGEAGLKVREVYECSPTLGDSIVECVLFED